MDAIVLWLRSVFIVAILAIVAEMVIPNSSFRSYVRFFMGLLITITILSPLSNILKQDFYWDSEWFERALGVREVHEIEFELAGTEDLVLEEYRKRINTAVEQVILNYDGISDVRVNTVIEEDRSHREFGKIRSVSILIWLGEKRDGILRVEPVEIGQTTGEYSREFLALSKEIKDLLYRQYGIRPEQIDIQFVEEG